MKKKKKLVNEKDLNTEATERNHKGQKQNVLLSSALFTNTGGPGLRITVLNVLIFSWPVPESICTHYFRTKRTYAMLC